MRATITTIGSLALSGFLPLPLALTLGLCGLASLKILIDGKK